MSLRSVLFILFQSIKIIIINLCSKRHGMIGIDCHRWASAPAQASLHLEDTVVKGQQTVTRHRIWVLFRQPFHNFRQNIYFLASFIVQYLFYDHQKGCYRIQQCFSWGCSQNYNPLINVNQDIAHFNLTLESRKKRSENVSLEINFYSCKKNC